MALDAATDPRWPAWRAAGEQLDARLGELGPTRAAEAAEEVVAWVAATLGAGAGGAADIDTPAPAPLRIALTSAFGPEGCALIHLVRRHLPEVPVYFIDTGLLFPATLAVRDAFVRSGANIVTIEPLVTLRAQAEAHGPELWRRDTDACCGLRKVEPMQRVLDQVDVWLTAVRRDQAASRAATPVVGTAARRDGTRALKIAPLVHWTRDDTWRYLLAHEVPYNPLLDAGYTSIGCEPCTAVPAPGQGERDGRWAGAAKTECGIHGL